MRLFFAIELPPEVQAALGALRPKDDNRDYRWVDPALMHLTLAFLGEQAPERLEALREVAEHAVRGARPGTLRLGAPATFGARNAPRVLLVGVAGDLDALAHLQTSLDHGLRQAGFAMEDRPYRPHITLARRRPSARGGPPPGWPPVEGLARRDFPMDRLTLFESRLSPRGASYLAVFQVPITG